MTWITSSVVRRHMKRTSPGAFTPSDHKEQLPVALSLTNDESVIGWYRNPPPWETCLIVFTSEAFYIIDAEHVDRVTWDSLVGYENPESKADVTGIRVLTNDGFRFVRVAGSFGPHGHQKDAYSFLMIVRALIPDEPIIRFKEQTPKD